MNIDIHTFPSGEKRMTQIDVPAQDIAALARAVNRAADALDANPKLTNISITIPVEYLHVA